MIRIRVNKTNAEILESEFLTSGRVGEKLGIEYSAEWTGLTVVACFSNGSVNIDVMNPSTECTIPHEVLAEAGKSVTVGFYGYELSGEVRSKVIPTVYVNLGRVKLGAEPAGASSVAPTPPIWLMKQDKLVAGSGINIAADGKTISAEGKTLYEHNIKCHSGTSYFYYLTFISASATPITNEDELERAIDWTNPRACSGYYRVQDGQAQGSGYHFYPLVSLQFFRGTNPPQVYVETRYIIGDSLGNSSGGGVYDVTDAVRQL